MSKFYFSDFLIFVGVMIFIVAILFAITQKPSQEPPQDAPDHIPDVGNMVLPPDPCGLKSVICEYEQEEKLEPKTIQVRIRESAENASIEPDRAIRIAGCESSFDPRASNPDSSAKGLYQFTDGTWDYIGSPGDRLNADDSIAAFMEWYPKHSSWWMCK